MKLEALLKKLQEAETPGGPALMNDGEVWTRVTGDDASGLVGSWWVKHPTNPHRIVAGAFAVDASDIEEVSAETEQRILTARDELLKFVAAGCPE